VRWYLHHLRKSSTYGRFSLANLVISATTSGGQTSRGEIPLLLSICTSAPSCTRKAATTTYGSTAFPSLRATNWSLTYIHINNKQTIIMSVNQHNVKPSFNDSLFCWLSGIAWEALANMSTYSHGDKTIRPWFFIWILATMKAARKPQDWLHKQFKFKTTFDYRSLAFSTTVGCSFAAMETSCVTVFTSDNNKKWIPFVCAYLLQLWWLWSGLHHIFVCCHNMQWCMAIRTC